MKLCWTIAVLYWKQMEEMLCCPVKLHHTSVLLTLLHQATRTRAELVGTKNQYHIVPEKEWSWRLSVLQIHIIAHFVRHLSFILTWIWLQPVTQRYLLLYTGLKWNVLLIVLLMKYLWNLIWVTYTLCLFRSTPSHHCQDMSQHRLLSFKQDSKKSVEIKRR